MLRAENAAREAATEGLKRQISIRRPERTSIIEISVATTTATKAAALANAVARSYLNLVATNQADLAVRTTGLLNQRLDALRRRLRTAESKVQAFKTRNDLIGTDKTLVSEAQLSDISVQLGLARTRMAEARSRYEQVEAARRSPDLLGTAPEAILSATVGSLRVQDVEARRQLASLRAVLGEQHPGVVAASAQASAVRRSLEGELSRIAASARAELLRATQSEAQILKSLDGLKKEVADAGQASVELRELERQADADKSVYEAFLTRARETSELSNLDTTNASLVTAAIPPAFKSFPPRMSVLMAMSVVLGVLFGLAVVLFVEIGMPGLIGRRPAVPVPDARRPGAPSPDPEPMPVFAIGPLAPALRPTQANRRLDLTMMGVPALRADDALGASLVEGLLDRLRPGPASIVVAGRNDGLRRSALALAIALAAQRRGLSTALVDMDHGDRRLTRMAMASLSSLPRVFADQIASQPVAATANGILLVMNPSSAIGGFDPDALGAALFPETMRPRLIVVDGPSDIDSLRRGGLVARPGIGLAFVLDTGEVPPDGLLAAGVAAPRVFVAIPSRLAAIAATRRPPVRSVA